MRAWGPRVLGGGQDGGLTRNKARRSNHHSLFEVLVGPGEQAPPHARVVALRQHGELARARHALAHVAHRVHGLHTGTSRARSGVPPPCVAAAAACCWPCGGAADAARADPCATAPQPSHQQRVVLAREKRAVAAAVELVHLRARWMGTTTVGATACPVITGPAHPTAAPHLSEALAAPGKGPANSGDARVLGAGLAGGEQGRLAHVAAPAVSALADALVLVAVAQLGAARGALLAERSMAAHQQRDQGAGGAGPEGVAPRATRAAHRQCISTHAAGSPLRRLRTCWMSLNFLPRSAWVRPRPQKRKHNTTTAAQA